MNKNCLDINKKIDICQEKTIDRLTPLFKKYKKSAG